MALSSLSVPNPQPSPLAIPVGVVIAVAHSSTVAGFIKCTGALISRSTYARLFAVIGTTYGAGNGSTTFAVPDFRGVFLRGLDESKGYDSARAIATYQADAMASHTHVINMGNNVGVGYGGWDRARKSTGTVNTGSAGGAETRPKNQTVTYHIRF